MYYVYILKLKNGQYYTGYTQDLDARLKKHESHSVPTTKRIQTDHLVFSAAFLSQEKALAFEKYLKSSSGFAFRNKRLL
jgi:putative endonuclease